jgi:hypothetical protein
MEEWEAVFLRRYGFPLRSAQTNVNLFNHLLEGNVNIPWFDQVFTVDI